MPNKTKTFLHKSYYLLPIKAIKKPATIPKQKAMSVHKKKNIPAMITLQTIRG